jgi:hypothetical protein
MYSNILEKVKSLGWQGRKEVQHLRKLMLNLCWKIGSKDADVVEGSHLRVRKGRCCHREGQAPHLSGRKVSDVIGKARIIVS